MGALEGALPHLATRADVHHLELRLYGAAIGIVVSTAGVVIGALSILLN